MYTPTTSGLPPRGLFLALGLLAVALLGVGGYLAVGYLTPHRPDAGTSTRAPTAETPPTLGSGISPGPETAEETANAGANAASPGTAGSAPSPQPPVIMEERPSPAAPEKPQEVGSGGPPAEYTERPPAPKPAKEAVPKGKATIPAKKPTGSRAMDGITRSFVNGRTTVENTRPIGSELQGFDLGGVEVKRAPDVLGSIEFEVVPAKVKPGDAFNVKVYLRNQGKKAIPVDELIVASRLNGKQTAVALTPKHKEVGPREVALIAELPGIWKAGVDSWSVEVALTSKAGDTYKNKVTWR